MTEQIKRLLQDDTLFYSFLLLAVGIVSFGLGRLSSVAPVTENATNIILTETTPALRTNTAAQSPSQYSQYSQTEPTELVASKNGTKYHYLWCPGAKQMKEENKIFFTSIEAARAAGYAPAANCSGLE